MAEIVSPLLLEYVNEGGNLIVQYNTSYRLKTKEFSLTLFKFQEIGLLKKMLKSHS